MAYSSNWRWRGLLYALFAPFTALFTAIGVACKAMFEPTPSARLELDRALADLRADAGRRAAPFMAFLKRALDHDAYRAGHFDPGRCSS